MKIKGNKPEGSGNVDHPKKPEPSKELETLAEKTNSLSSVAISSIVANKPKPKPISAQLQPPSNSSKVTDCIK